MSQRRSITDDAERSRIELRVDGELAGWLDKTVIPTCPFAAAYIDRHPELEEFLAPSARRRST